jgi:5-methylcytosine-specific restriction endonuclease McrA
MRNLQPSELIDPSAIYERDAWVCGICDLAVEPAERFPSPGAATIDHVIPVSRGGLHAAENVQCAHFYCNSVKGNRPMEPAC